MPDRRASSPSYDRVGGGLLLQEPADHTRFEATLLRRGFVRAHATGRLRYDLHERWTASAPRGAGGGAGGGEVVGGGAAGGGAAGGGAAGGGAAGVGAAGAEVGAEVEWFEWPRARGRFLWFRGPDWGELRRAVRAEVRGVLPEDVAGSVLLALVSNRDRIPEADLAQTVLWVGYLHPMDAILVVEIADRLMADPSPLLRAALVEAWAIHEWPAVRAHVGRLAAGDPDAAVREAAAAVLFAAE